MSKIDWNEIEKSNVLVLKEGSTIKVRFLDNGIKDSKTIVDNRTDKEKVIDCFIFKVMDLYDNKEKELSVIQSGLMSELKKFVPLENKELDISKLRIGSTDFDIEFRVEKHK